MKLGPQKFINDPLGSSVQLWDPVAGQMLLTPELTTS